MQKCEMDLTKNNRREPYATKPSTKSFLVIQRNIPDDFSLHV